MMRLERRKPDWVALVLFCSLVALYTLTFLGINTSNDGLYLFDSTESFVKRGDFRITYKFDLLAPDLDDEQAVPLPPAQHEVLQPILAAPFFWFAQHVPGIGLMHTVWLFNVLVTAATAVLLYWGGQWLGYSSATTLHVAIIFAVGTMAWPYSRTFFREPLTAFFVLGAFLSAYMLEWQPVSWKWLIGLILSVVGMLMTKLGIVVMLPAMVPLMFKSWPQRRHMILLIVAALLVMAAFLAAGELAGIRRFQIDYWSGFLSDIEWQYVGESLVGHSVSPGRSVLLFSPVLLLGFAGGYQLYRQGQWRMPLAAVSALVLVMLSYGARSDLWWGGVHWGPRHMVSLLPILCLLLLPVISDLKGWRWLVVLLLFAISILVQLLGIWVSVGDYYDSLSANNIRAWEDGLWGLQWSPIPQTYNLLDVRQPEVAWHYIPDTAWPVVTLAAATVVLGGWLLLRQVAIGRFALLFPVMTALSIGVGLVSLEHDPRYTGDDSGIRDMFSELNERVDRDSGLFIQHTSLSTAFMNYFKPDAFVAGLPYAPGENYDPAVDPASMIEAPADTLLGINSVRVIDWAATQFDELWIVVDTVPGIPNELRPTERYMVENYFAVEEFRFSKQIRGIKFVATRAPGMIEPPGIETSYQFGNELMLLGYDLPHGSMARPGDMVPVSLVWQPLRPLERDYLVSVQIAQPDLPPVAQRDGLPQATFGYTSTWELDHTYRDNHGLSLPDNVLPGEYRLQVVVYAYPELSRLSLEDGLDIAVLQTFTVR